MGKPVWMIPAFAGAVMLSAPIHGQSLGLSLDVNRTATPPAAYVQLSNLFAAEPFESSMRAGFPLYLEYELSLREKRSNWFDRSSEAISWQYVVSFDPIRERFTVETESSRFELADNEALKGWVNSVQSVPLMLPRETGTYYYMANLRARSLSDEDVDEVFEWLHGNNSSNQREKRGLLTRTARKLLVRVAPLPTASLSAQTEPFDWPIN